MNISRPFSAPKCRTKKQESKLVISGFKRPNSAKAHSLKQIIQVIQNTLNRGAHTVLTKTKTMDKFSKVKQQVQILKRLNDKKGSCQKQLPQFPQYRTQFLIGNSCQFPKTVNSVRSSKILSKSKDSSEFVPYKKLNSCNGKDEARKITTGVQKYSSRKLERKPKLVKQTVNKQKQNIFGEIEGWQNNESVTNFTYLLQA